MRVRRELEGVTAGTTAVLAAGGRSQSLIIAYLNAEEGRRDGEPCIDRNRFLQGRVEMEGRAGCLSALSHGLVGGRGL